MTTDARKLELLDDLERVVDAAESLALACDAIARFLVNHSGVEEALILTERATEGQLQPGSEGREDVSEELKALARVVHAAGDDWQVTSWGEITARPLVGLAGTDGASPPRVGILLYRIPDGAGGDDGIVDFVAARAARLLRSALSRQNLEERSLELETIYEIDHIRDQHLGFEAMLQKIMGRVLELIPADGAVVALRSAHVEGADLKLHSRPRTGQTAALERLLRLRKDDISQVVDDAFAERRFIERLLPGDESREVACMPLILDDEILGGFLLVSAPRHRFSPRDERLFSAVCSQTDTAIFEDLQQQRLKDVFKRTVSKDVFDEMLRTDADFFRGDRRSVTCFFSDLRGFTSVSEQLDVDVVVEMLNEHLEAMTQVVFRHGGTVDKFIGDCVMAFFGAPLAMADHVERAVRCAMEMRHEHNRIADGWAARGLPGVKIGIGLHTGPVFVGPIGGASLSSYTIIGDNVNLAARLEGESGPDDIIVTREVLDHVEQHVTFEPRGEVVVKGKTVPSEIFNVTGSK